MVMVIVHISNLYVCMHHLVFYLCRVVRNTLLFLYCSYYMYIRLFILFYIFMYLVSILIIKGRKNVKSGLLLFGFDTFLNRCMFIEIIVSDFCSVNHKRPHKKANIYFLSIN